MESLGTKDKYLDEYIPEIKTFMALHSNSYRIVSSSSFSNYMQGLSYLAQEEFDLASQCFEEGSIKGNPYCQYSLYTLFASSNDFKVEKQKEKVLYYLISSALNFSIGLINEDSAHKQLYCYIMKYDDPQKTYCHKILEAEHKRMTNFDERKDVAFRLFDLMMTNNEQNRESLRKCLEGLDESEYRYSLMALRFGHVEDGFKIIDNVSFGNFVLDYCHELILYFTRTGLMDCAHLSMAQSDAFLICLYYIIFKGKSLDSKFDVLVLELIEFCNLITQETSIKINEEEESGKEILFELKPILILLKAYFYINGRFLKKSKKKTLEILKSFDSSGHVDVSLQALADFLYLKSYYKLWKEYKVPDNIGELFQYYHKHYNFKTLSLKKSQVIEFYIAGYIQEKHLKDLKEARIFYNLGLDIVPKNEYDITDLMCFYTFRRKCSSRAMDPNKIDDILD